MLRNVTTAQITAVTTATLIAPTATVTTTATTTTAAIKEMATRGRRPHKGLPRFFLLKLSFRCVATL